MTNGKTSEERHIKYSMDEWTYTQEECLWKRTEGILRERVDSYRGSYARTKEE